MDLEKIKSKIKYRDKKPLGIKETYSVLIPVIKINDQLNLLFEMRSEDLGTQPGEISFPGGKIEDGETPKQAALRETMEELRIPKGKIKIIGDLDYLISPYNVLIYSYAGFLDIKDLKYINFNEEEVQEVIKVPLSFFNEEEPDIYKKKFEIILEDDFPYHLIPNGKNYSWREGEYPIYFYEYEGYTIWGFTARLTRNFMEIIDDD